MTDNTPPARFDRRAVLRRAFRHLERLARAVPAITVTYKEADDAVRMLVTADTTSLPA